jgi:hypothetical protein
MITRCLNPLLARSGVALLLLSCSDSALEPIVACTDDQEVTVAVSAGTIPRFTWDPSCGMASVQVWATETSTDGWVLYSGSHAAENPLPSGLRYGEIPPKGLEPVDPVPLRRGAEYVVAVYRWVGEPGGPGSIFERGRANFRP